MSGKKAEYGSHVEEIDGKTSLPDHVNLGCTQRECKPNETIIEQFKKMFESRISAREKPHAKTVAWFCDMEGHARKCVERYCELADKQSSGAIIQSFKSLLG